MRDVVVCICTHNPRVPALDLVINALARQDVALGCFQVLVVDNGSSPAIRDDVLRPLRESGLVARLVREETLGLPHARLRAIRETDSDWLLFVDDDNELFPDFIRAGLDFCAAHPDVGCFGGRLLLPPHVRVGHSIRPFLPYLGIKDEGEVPLIGKGETWGPWEPPGAGAWVARSVAEEYVRRAAGNDNVLRLGRSGTRNLASCDDSMMMRGAHALGLSSAYVPALRLYHHIAPKRFKLRYLLRLMRAYGASHVVLESTLNGPQPVPPYYRRKQSFLLHLVLVFFSEWKKSTAYALGRVFYLFGHRDELLKMEQCRQLEP